MKIRNRIIINFLAIAIVPITLAFILLALITSYRSQSEVKNNLENQIVELKMEINNDLDRLRSLAVVFSKSVKVSFQNNKPYIDFQGHTILSLYNIQILEATYESQVIRRNFAMSSAASDVDDITVFATSDSFTAYIWDYLSHPLFNQNSSMSFPDIVSNQLIMRNAALIYNEAKDQKMGLVIASVVINSDYLSQLASNNPDLVLFIETPHQVILSDSEMNSDNDLKALLRKKGNKPQTADLVHLKSRGRFYVYKMPLFAFEGKDVATLGILYGFQSVNKLMSVLGSVGMGIFIFSLVTAIVVAFLFARKITVPIVNLSEMVVDFEKDYRIIPPPEKIIDEISHLQNSFSLMTKNITSFKQESDNYNTLLTQEVQAKTFDLLNKVRSLSLINDFSSFTMNIDFLNEMKYIKKSIMKLKELLDLKYIAVFMHKGGKLRKLDYFYSDEETPDKSTKKKLDNLERRFAERSFRTAEFLSRSSGNIAVFSSPVYFIDQMEYCLFYIGIRRKKGFIEEAMSTIINLYSMKIYSIRINKSKLESDKLASIGQFASTIIHDIKNPLTTIKSAIEILSDEDYTEEEKENYKNILKREIDLLTSMLNDVLDFARGTIRLIKEDTNIDELLRDLAIFYESSVQESPHHIEFVTHLNSKAVLKADRHRLWRCVGNIIANAIDALRSDGTITITSEKKIYDVLIKVEDTGTGIPEEIKDNIFEPFFTHGKSNGTGLGLAIVKKIIESHGGNIVFKSETGKGTIFYISLPL